MIMLAILSAIALSAAFFSYCCCWVASRETRKEQNTSEAIKMINCKYYDIKNGWCKKLSDQHDIEYCANEPCLYYEPQGNMITVQAKYNIGDEVFKIDRYNGQYRPIGPFIIDRIDICVNNQGTQLSYGISNDAGTYTATENHLFSTDAECIEWCQEQNRNCDIC